MSDNINFLYIQKKREIEKALKSQKWNLDHLQLGQRGIDYLITKLKTYQISELNLKSNLIDANSLSKLASTLQSQNNLKKLFLDSNYLTKNGKKGLESLKIFVTNNKNLKVLSLEKTRLEHEDIKIINYIIKNSELDFLNLKWNNLNDDSILSILETLKNSKKILKVNIIGNSITDKNLLKRFLGLNDYFEKMRVYNKKKEDEGNRVFFGVNDRRVLGMDRCFGESKENTVLNLSGREDITETFEKLLYKEKNKFFHGIKDLENKIDGLISEKCAVEREIEDLDLLENDLINKNKFISSEVKKIRNKYNFLKSKFDLNEKLLISRVDNLEKMILKNDSINLKIENMYKIEKNKLIKELEEDFIEKIEIIDNEKENLERENKESRFEMDTLEEKLKNEDLVRENIKETKFCFEQLLIRERIFKNNKRIEFENLNKKLFNLRNEIETSTKILSEKEKKFSVMNEEILKNLEKEKKANLKIKFDYKEKKINEDDIKNENLKIEKKFAEIEMKEKDLLNKFEENNLENILEIEDMKKKLEERIESKEFIRDELELKIHDLEGKIKEIDHERFEFCINRRNFVDSVKIRLKEEIEDQLVNFRNEEIIE